MAYEQRSTTIAPSASASARPTQNTSNPLLDQALKRHLESLQPEDREAFEQCTAEDVIAAAEQLSSAHTAQSRARRYLARFADVVRPLEAYFDLIGGVIGLVPGAQLVGVVWGALRFVVQVSSRIISSGPSLAAALTAAFRVGCQRGVGLLRANCWSFGGNHWVPSLLPRLCP